MAVDAVKRIIADSPSAPHRIRALGAQVGVSPFHLARLFRAATGESLHQYVIRVRMESALVRLGRGEADLSRLALELGFSSHSHFSTVFRRHFGTSPTLARASMRQRGGPDGQRSFDGFASIQMSPDRSTDRSAFVVPTVTEACL
jgi:AraC-like DNA-binding protein